MKSRITLIAVLCILFFLSFFLLKVKNDMNDFEVNYKAGKRIQYGETLYRFADGHYMFKYPPPASFFYIPLTYLPINTAKGIWYFLIVIWSCLIVHISYALIPPEWNKSIYLMILPPLILIKYFLRELDLGQINVLVTLIILLMFRLRKKELLSGILWGLSMALKPYTLIFLPYFMIKGRWKTLVSGVMFLALAFLSPALFYGFRGNLTVIREWYSTLSATTPALFGSWDNISLIGCFTKWTGDSGISSILYIVFVTLLALWVLFLIQRGKGLPGATLFEYAILLTLIPLVSPLGWNYTLLMSLTGIMILISRFSFFQKFWKYFLIFNFALVFITFYDIMGSRLHSAFMLLSITTVIFLILFGYMSSLRLRRIT